MSRNETGADAQIRAAERSLYAAMIDKDFPALERMVMAGKEAQTFSLEEDF